VQRGASRLDLTKESNPKKIEQDLMTVIPKEKWISSAHQIIHLGRGALRDADPKCGECKLNPVCYAQG
jgi:endonuclease III